MNLGEASFIGHIAEVQDTLSEGRAMLVGEGLDSGVPMVVDGSLVGGLQGVCEVHDSGREGGVGQAWSSYSEARHLGSNPATVGTQA